MPTFNFRLPDMPGEQEDSTVYMKKLVDYIYQLNEQLRYQFSNIDDQNIIPGSLTEAAFDRVLYKKIVDAAGNYSLFMQTATNILLQVSGLSNRNLIRNSDTPKTGTTTIAYPLDLVLFKTLAGKVMSFSVDVWDDTDGDHVVDICLMDQSGVVGAVSAPCTIPDMTTVMRPSLTQVLPNLDASTELSLVIRAAAGYPGDFKATRPKAEIGKNATDWSASPLDPLNGLETGTVLIDGSGVYVTGGVLWLLAGGLLKLEGSVVNIDTPYFLISKDGQERLIFDEDGNLAIKAGSVASDRFIGNIVNKYMGNGAESIATGASIYTNLLNLGKYLPVPVTLAVPAGTYNENITIEGFTGACLTILLASGAAINGQWMIRDCSNVAILRDGSGTLPVLTGITGDPTVLVSNVGFFHAESLDVRGKPRTTALDGSVSCISVVASKAAIISCDLKRALYGLLVGLGSNVYAEDNIGGITGSTDPTTLALLSHGIYADQGSHVGVEGSVPFGGVADADASDSATIAGTGTGGGTGDPTIPDDPPTTTAYASNAYYRMTRIERRTGSSVNGGSISWGSYSWWGYAAWAIQIPRQGNMQQSAVVTGTSGGTVNYRQNRDNWFSAWIFPTIANLSSITAARLTIARDVEGGSTGAVTIPIYYHDFTGMPTENLDRERLIPTGMAVSLARGASATIALNATTLNLLKAGTIKGFGLGAASSYAQMAIQASLEVDT